MATKTNGNGHGASVAEQLIEIITEESAAVESLSQPTARRTTTRKPAEPVSSQILIPQMRYGQLKVRIKGVDGSRLVTHRFAQKAMMDMLTTQMKLKSSVSKERAAKDPVKDFVGGLYSLGDPRDVVVKGEFKPEMLEIIEYGVPKIYIDSRYEANEARVVTTKVEGQEGETVPADSRKLVPAVTAYGRFGFPAVGFKAAMATAAIDRNVKTTKIHRNIRIPGELIEIESPHGATLRVDMVRLQGMGSPADIRFRPEFTDWTATVLIQYDLEIFNLDTIINLVSYAGWTVGLGEWRQEKGGQWGAFLVDAVESIEDITFRQDSLIPREGVNG